MKITMKVEGLKEVRAALDELPKATSKNVIKRVLLKQAEPIVRAARAAAPVRYGHLKRSIIALYRSTGGDAGKSAFAQARAGGASRAEAGQAARAANRGAGGSAEVIIGPGRHPQAIFQEFGTEHHPAHPFLRPAWDSNKDKVLEGIKDDLWAEIKKAAQRLARKAAK